VIPHQSLTVAFDERCEELEVESTEVCANARKSKRTTGNNNNAGGSGPTNRNEANMTFYQIYCATATLVDHVKTLMGGAERRGDDYNKRVLTF
ncbi:hypothetical protein, partial [Klebsiella pneumoniae]|uniref:hypothetical protein n=1 Tax=Klebsiella pneumoniae TaxID=573 RepID=UPI001C8F7365